MGLFVRKGKAKAPTTLFDCYEVSDKIGEGQYAEVFSAKVSEASCPAPAPAPWAAGGAPSFGCAHSRAVGEVSPTVSSRCSPFRAPDGKARCVPWNVAVKSIDKSKVACPGDLSREIELMASLAGHPNIVQLYEVFDDRKYTHLVLELMPGGNLFDHIVEQGVCSEVESAEILDSLCSALDHMHQRMIVHRDVKPENLIFASPTRSPSSLKLGDFGTAACFGEHTEALQSVTGTPGYVPPEVLAPDGARKQTLALDTWAVGVICYVMLCGFPPFYDEDEDVQALFEQIRQCRYDFPSPQFDNVSQNAISLVKSLLTRDTRRRLSAAQVLAHPWVRNPPKNGVAYEGGRGLSRGQRRFRKCVLCVMAANRMEFLVKQLWRPRVDEGGLLEVHVAAVVSES